MIEPDSPDQSEGLEGEIVKLPAGAKTAKSQNGLVMDESEPKQLAPLALN